uniref:Uncharacterized protein n=1 Tax=Panagrolaimus sp. PS1159 TaxID=55785 RepID=A0AC35G5K9_9BILA
MSSDEYVEIELDVDNKPQINGVHVVGVTNNTTKYEYNKGYEVVEASSYKREGSRTTPIINEKSLCLVCDGPANGIHFKALSCAACNAFFRRSVAENRKYICREDGKCQIDYKARCLCRACRLKKCLIIGMDPGSVQPQRDAIGSKKKGEYVERNGRKGSIVSAKAEIVTAEPVAIIRRKRKASTPLSEEPVADEGEEEMVNEQMYESPESIIYPFSDDTTPRQSSTKEILDGTVVIEWGSVGNLIEEVLCSYQQLQERRRLFYCPRSIRDLLGGTVPTFKKIEGYFEKDKLDIESAIIVEFLRSIQPFAMLDLETQVCLVRAFCLPMTIIEKHYMTYKQGGHLTNRIYHQNYSYIDLNEAEKLMLDEPASIQNNHSDVDTRHINHKTMVSINIPYMKKALNDIVLPMSSVEMTDVEIVGLMLIMLFDPFAKDLNETAKKVVKAVRDRVYEDWFAVYTHNGIINGPEKIGNVVLITSAIQEFAQLIPQNFHFVRVFGLTDYDEILNDVFFK